MSVDTEAAALNCSSWEDAATVDAAPQRSMKKVKRVGHGFRNLHNYRLRLLLHCGGVAWQGGGAPRRRARHFAVRWVRATAHPQCA